MRGEEPVEFTPPAIPDPVVVNLFNLPDKDDA